MATDCPAVLDLLRDGRVSGKTPCRLPAGHDGKMHRAKWKESSDDEREIDFYDPDRMAYDVASRGFVVNKPAPAAMTPATNGVKSKSQAKRIAVQTSAQAPLQISTIALDELVESPFNKRRTWGDLKELAASMGNGVGILEPLLARQIGDGRYELVFGHRRLRAAKIAGLKAAPVMVRELADDVALEMQAIENLQRQDLHPIEEAETFEQLQRGGWSPDAIANKIGKSRSFVFGRLKLLALCAEARKAFYEGTLTASTALYVARIPDKKLQLEAIKDIAGDDDEEPMGARQAQALITREYMLRLVDAPFDTADATLVPKAGACTTCPHRTGNQAELFADVGSPDVCTNTTCFGAKRSAHGERVAEELAAKGAKVLDEKASRKLFPDTKNDWQIGRLDYNAKYADLGEKHYVGNRQKTLGALLKGSDVEIVVARDQRGDVHQLVAKTAADAALRKAQGQSSKASATPADAKRKAEEKKARERGLAKRRRTEALIASVVSSAERTAPNAAFWRLLARALVRGAWHDTTQEVIKRRELDTGKGNRRDFEKLLFTNIDTLSAEKLRGFVVEFVCAKGAHFSHREGEHPSLSEAIKHFDIDAKAAVKAYETDQELKKQAKTDAKKGGGKLPNVHPSLAKRARRRPVIEDAGDEA